MIKLETKSKSKNLFYGINLCLDFEGLPTSWISWRIKKKKQYQIEDLFEIQIEI